MQMIFSCIWFEDFLAASFSGDVTQDAAYVVKFAQTHFLPEKLLFEMFLLNICAYNSKTLSSRHTDRPKQTRYWRALRPGADWMASPEVISQRGRKVV